jgi:tetratricopeptide (TPR) repeat protein
MTLASNRRRFVFSILLSAYCTVGAAIAEPGSGGPKPLPKLEPLSVTAASMRKAREEVLSSLYDQLKIAENADAAERIASAIEKLWSQSGSDTADLLMERANLAIKVRNYDLATELLTALTDIEPRYVAGWSQLATVYFLRENYAGAMHRLRRVLALDPRHYKAIEGLGIILRETGNKKSALEVTRRALAVHPFLNSAKQASEELSREVEGQDI